VARHARTVAHARPRVPDAPAALVSIHPLTPLSERDRHRRRPGRRLVLLVVFCVAIVVAVPIVGAALASSAPQLQPLVGGVAGAASQPSPDPGSGGAGGPSAAPLVDQPSNSGGTGHPTRDDVRTPRIAPEIATLTGYVWPIPKGRISLPFKAIPGGEWNNAGRLFHDGVDMASFCGAPVGAAHAGVVLAGGRHFDDEIGWIGDLRPYYARLDATHTWGNLPIVVVIDDGNGYRSIYAHFHDVTVKRGQVVRAGQLIGHEGETGHASGCHVHYGLFSPDETRTFGTRPDIVRRLKVPTLETARIDPLAVLPRGDVAVRTRNIGKAIAAALASARYPRPAVGPS
jgi:murein DD-endopeptidase MepM/ murein hydrolase activator NlpD